MDSDEPVDIETLAVEDVDTDMAAAFGLFALSDATLPEAAKEMDVTRWELEETIQKAGLAGTFGLDQDADVSSKIDDLLGDDAE
jgi:hypothetical protein